LQQKTVYGRTAHYWAHWAQDSQTNSYDELTEVLKPEISEEIGKEVKLRPKIVVEVAYEEIQKSPTYSSGYALRFPRLVRIRTDKGPEDIDTLSRIKELAEKEMAKGVPTP